MKVNECYVGRIVRHREHGACKVVKRATDENRVSVSFGGEGWAATMTAKAKDLFPMGKEAAETGEEVAA